MTPEEERRLEKGKNIEAMLNDFLLEKHKITILEVLNRSGEDNKTGEISATHKIMLQQMVKSKFPNIDELINQKEETSEKNGQQLGFMTMVEWELIEDLLNTYIEEKEKGAIPDVEYLVESPAKVA